MLIGILRNQDPESSRNWEIACEKKNIAFRTIDLTSNNWKDDINKYKFDFFIHRPPGDIEIFKKLFDERLYIITEIYGYKIFPGLKETFIYENKRWLSYFLEAANIPCPKTNVFYNYSEALEYINTSKYPFFAKSNIGAAGSGVKKIDSKKTAKKYLHKSFKGKGIRRRFGPNRMVGNPKKWISKALNSPKYFLKKLYSYSQIYKDSQRNFVIFQEYVEHDFEWRVVKIGHSFFAYKKFKVDDKASGAKALGYDNPPLKLLDFVKGIALKNNIISAAFDIFPVEEYYLVNEIQTIFGHINSHILEVNGIPGRYIYKKSKWIFEKGAFNTNESYDLRLETALGIFKENAGE